jgi:hypothetical protein
MENIQEKDDNFDLVSQQNQNNNSKVQFFNSSENNKTNIITRIIFTVILYITLICVSISIYYIFVYLQTDPKDRWIYADFENAVQTIFFVGVAGVIPLFGGSATLFLFPFAQVVATLLVIFVVVSALEKWKIITRHKKIFISLFIFSLTFISGVGFFDTIKKIQHKKQATDERNYYEKTYETQKAVESNSLFIYPKDNEVFASDIYGNNKKTLFSSSSEKNIGYVSPNGKYFVSCEDYGGYGKCRTLMSNDNPSQKTDLCIMKTADDFGVCPNFCAWDYSSSSFACSYGFYGYIDKTKETTPSKKSVLVLFGLQDGNHKIIAQRTEDNDPNNLMSNQNFVFIDKNTILFIDQKNGNNFYKAENLYDCPVKISEMGNLSGCNNFIIDKNEIYCSVNAKDYNIETKDKENFWVDWREYYIIKQNLNQALKSDYTVISKAPMSESELMYNVNDKFIFIVPISGSIKILDTETGLARDMGGDYAWNRENKNDDNLIFSKYGIYTDIKTIPKPYKENVLNQENEFLQECDVYGENVGNSLQPNNNVVSNEINQSVPSNNTTSQRYFDIKLIQTYVQSVFKNQVKECINKGNRLKGGIGGGLLCESSISGNWATIGACGEEQADTKWIVNYNSDNWTITLECKKYPECSSLENIKCAKDGCIFSDKCKI